MAEIKWIKIVTDIFDDEKILLIESMPEADSVIVVWFKLLCLAGKQNNGGVFTLNDKIAYTDEMLATIFRRPLNTVRLALSTFEHFGMIEIVDNVITIPNWEKHQQIDTLEKIRLQGRQRKQKQRARQKLLLNGGENEQNVTVTGQSRSVTQERENKKKIENKNSLTESQERKGAKAPALEDVKSYFKEKSYKSDPHKFYSYYDSREWLLDGKPIRKWQSLADLWESREKQFNTEIANAQSCRYTAEELDALMIHITDEDDDQ